MNIDTGRAISLRDSGLPWHAVATQCNSTVHLVRRALAAAGYKHDKRYLSLVRRCRKELLSAHELDRMKRLKAAGATWKELGRITGIDCRKLERYVKCH
jgi:hypothetical protein